jgi:hypothetical protein
MWVLLHKDDSLTARVEQQLDTGHARTGRHEAGVDAIDVPTLEQRILLRVDRLTAIEVRPTWRIGPRAGMWESRWMEGVMMVAVR